jgi:hypothetical protein
MTRHIRIRTLAALAALAIAAPALAGPPLLCHPFEIGSARSLPWTQNWSQGRPDYKLENLIADTDALLTASTPVIVRMETLRRAAIYASGDQRVATELLKRLVARAQASDAAGHPDPLAFLDAAYVAGAFHEINYLSSQREWVTRAAAARAALGNTDGYALVAKSISTRPEDPAIQFAAALIASDANRTRYADHAAKARAGADRDPLLARNISHVQ